MAFRELECTQGVWGYQTANRTFVQKGGKRILAWTLRPPPARCRRCGSRDVRAYSHRVRTLAGLPVGRCPVRFLVPVRKVICRRCGCATYERVPFAARRDARITRALASAILALARETSMSAIAGLFGVSWRTVRDAIADGLRKRYRKRDFGRVRNLGIDELHVFARERPSRRYVTVVRDVDSGEVLEVARGKGVAALRRFARKIAPFRDRIRTVSLDMASSYASWTASALPGATVVVDRFHVVKAMNDRVDRARRRVMARVGAETAKPTATSSCATARTSRGRRKAVLPRPWKSANAPCWPKSTSTRSVSGASTPLPRPLPRQPLSSTDGSAARRPAAFPNWRVPRRPSPATATASSPGGRPPAATTPRRKASTAASGACWRRPTASTTTRSCACGSSTWANATPSKADAVGDGPKRAVPQRASLPAAAAPCPLLPVAGLQSGMHPRHALANPCPYRRHRRRVPYDGANRDAAPCGCASSPALTLALLKDNVPLRAVLGRPLTLFLHFAGEP